MRKFSLLTALLSALFAHQVWAETLVLEPAKDNTLYEDAQGDLSNGAGNYLFMGRTGGDKGIPPSLRRTLLNFDISSIPPGSEITSVELQLTIDNVPLEASGGVSKVHRLLGDWGEGTSNAPGPEGQGTQATPGDATWIHAFFDTDSWQTAGGDFSGTASQSASFGTSPQTLVFISSAGLIADVSAWVDQPGDNFGWIVLGDEPVELNARRFNSREYGVPEQRPRLTVEYTPRADIRSVPTLGGAGLLLLVTLLLLVLWLGTPSARRA